MTYYFGLNFYYMNKYHHYEFQVNKKPFIMFYSASTFANLLKLGYLLIQFKIPEPWDIIHLINTCFNGENEVPMKIINVYRVLFVIPHLSDLFLCVAVIIYKKSDDIL